MSFFKMDEVEEVKGFGLIEQGEYEVTIINAEGGYTVNGNKEKLSVDFEIRSDVPQNHQGAKILYNVFTFAHPTAAGIAKSFFKAVGMPPNYAPSTPGEMAKDVMGKSLKIYVKHQKQDDGKVFPKSSSYKQSEVNAPAQQGPAITVGDSDLPF